MFKLTCIQDEGPQDIKVDTMLQVMSMSAEFHPLTPGWMCGCHGNVYYTDTAVRSTTNVPVWYVGQGLTLYMQFSNLSKVGNHP